MSVTEQVRNGQLRVWWIPQVGMNTVFRVNVPNLVVAKVLVDTLAQYDLYQYENNVKPDYANVGGLEVWDERIDADESGHKWTDWESPDYDGIDDVTVEQCAEWDKDGFRCAK